VARMPPESHPKVTRTGDVMVHQAKSGTVSDRRPNIARFPRSEAFVRCQDREISWCR
jgi:hypothetical protein